MLKPENILNLHNQSQLQLFGDDWNNLVQITLFDIKEDMLDQVIIHKMVRDYNERWGNIVRNIDIFFKGLILLFTGLSSYSDTNESVFSILSLVAGITVIVTGEISNRYKFSRKAFNHNSASNQYEDLANYIIQNLFIPPDKRPDCQVVFENVRNKQAFINEMAEPIPLTFSNEYYINNENRENRERKKLTPSWYNLPEDIFQNMYPQEELDEKEDSINV